MQIFEFGESCYYNIIKPLKPQTMPVINNHAIIIRLFNRPKKGFTFSDLQSFLNFDFSFKVTRLCSSSKR